MSSTTNLTLELLQIGATLVLTGASMEIANPLACILVILVQSLPDSSSIALPPADRPVKTWICQFIPCHLKMYPESFIIYIILHTTCCLGRCVSENRTHTSKIVSRKCIPLSVGLAIMGLLPIKV